MLWIIRVKHNKEEIPHLMSACECSDLAYKQTDRRKTIFRTQWSYFGHTLSVQVFTTHKFSSISVWSLVRVPMTPNTSQEYVTTDN